MAVKTIGTAESVTSSSFSGVDTNIYPSNGTAGVANNDEYNFSATDGITFGNNAACILGKPTVVDGTTLSADTLDITNSPYMWNGTRYVTNPNSIIQVTDGEYNIEERVTVRKGGSWSQNENFFEGNDTCRPVFYGVDWKIDSPNHVNWIGNNNAYTAAAPVFIDNTIEMLGQTGFAFRLRGDNFVIDGLTWTSMATTGAPAMEFATPPKVAPRGLVIAHPRLTDLSARTALAFLNNGTNNASGDPDNRFVFEALDAPNFPVYFGGSNAFSSSGRGAAMINSLGSPVPFDSATSNPDATTSGTNVNVQLNSRDIPHVLGGGQLGQFQRVNVTFDAPGYTLRIRRVGVESYTHGDFDASVFYKGGTKTSNGGLNRATTNYDSTTPSLGAAANSTVQSDANGTIDWDFVTDAAFDGTFRGEGYDVEVAGTEASIVLPAYMQLQIASSGTGGRTFPTIFFGWEIYAIHADRGITQVETLSFLPDTFDTRYGDGQDVEITFATPEDALYTSDRDISTAGSITDGAYLHDAVKKYEVERNSATDYDTSHLNSEIQVVTSTGTESDFGSRNVVFNPASGNRVVSSADISSTTAAITLKHSTNGVINTIGSDGAIEQKSTGLVTTGTLDLGEATFDYFDLEASTIDAENATVSNATMKASTSITATGIGKISEQVLETATINTVLGKFVLPDDSSGEVDTNNTYSGYQGTGNLSISFASLTDSQRYTPEELLGRGWSKAGTGTITLTSPDADVIVVTNSDDISAGDGVTFVLPDATIDFSGILAAESTFFSNAKVAFAPLLTLGNETLITQSDLTNGIYTFTGLAEDAEYVVGVSKPGRTNFRTTFTFTGGNVVTPLLMPIDAVTENIALVPDPNPDNLPTPAITSTRRAGGKTIYGLEHATTMNSMDGPQTVWVTELMKGTDMYVADLVAGLNVNILHTSTVDSEWDGTVFVMEPIAANQQVTGINGGLGNPNPVQDNGTLSIFINGATEVNYGTIDTLFDNNVAPIVTEVDTGFDQMATWMDTGNLRKANKVTTGRIIS